MALKKRLLITGASGFIGYYITELLVQQQYLVTALCRPESAGLKKLKTVLPDIHIVYGDINDFDTLDLATEQIDLVIHVAARVDFESTSRSIVHKVNVEGTTQLINLCIEKKINKFIHISSVSALGGLPDQKLFDEFALWDTKAAHNIYAVSKHLAELEVWRGSAEGMEVCILSPSVVIGRWFDDHHSMQLFNMIKKQLPFYPTGSTGWVDVRDVAVAVQKCVEQNIFQERIILNGHNLTYKEIMDDSATILKLKKTWYRLYYTPTWLGAKLINLICSLIGKKLVIPSSVVKAIFNHSSYNAHKSKEILHLEYKPIDESLKWILKDKPDH